MIRVDEFWNFLIAREQIRLNRLVGLPRERWTKDEIMRTYSFTNVKRLYDRTTMLLDREFYSRHADSSRHVVLLNAAVFRLHGTIEFARAVGWTTEWTDETRAHVRAVGESLMASGQTVFTSAYMIPNCGSTEPKTTIIGMILNEIAKVSRRVVVPDADKWEEACYTLCSCWGIGSFLAKEILLDYVLATGWAPSDWTTWTPVGPGARRGAGVVKYDSVRGIPEAEALEVCRTLYAMTEERWPTTWFADGYEFIGETLDLTDIQFQLCEFAKYWKAKSRVGKPKRLFRPTVDNITRGDTA